MAPWQQGQPPLEEDAGQWDGLQEQDGFHWTSDLGEATWQSRTAEIWYKWPREGETEKEAFPGSSCSSPTSCFGCCIPSSMMICSKTFRGSERITRTRLLLKRHSALSCIHTAENGVRIWCWTWQARDNLDQAKTQGPSPTGSARGWHRICESLGWPREVMDDPA